jgi:nucleoside-diphosphate-sugar epimerase
MKNILIIGNGYIGENLSIFLSSKHNVTVFSRSNTNKHPNINYVLGEIESLPFLLKDLSFDVVFNAFGSSRLKGFDNYSDFCNNNIYLLTKVLDYAANIKAKFIYPATSLCLPGSGDDSFYSFSHKLAIQTIKQYHKWYDLKYDICYLHNIYGSLTNSTKKYKMLVDVILEAHLNNLSMPLYNGGKQKRIFTHIKDVVRYFELSLMQNESNEVNLANKYHKYSVKSLIDIFDRIQIINKKDPLYTDHDPCGSPLGNLYGWEETINVKDWLLRQYRPK